MFVKVKNLKDLLAFRKLNGQMKTAILLGHNGYIGYYRLLNLFKKDESAGKAALKAALAKGKNLIPEMEQLLKDMAK